MELLEPIELENRKATVLERSRPKAVPKDHFSSTWASFPKTNITHSMQLTSLGPKILTDGA
jgi:hypothetical protein